MSSKRGYVLQSHHTDIYPESSEVGAEEEEEESFAHVFLSKTILWGFFGMRCAGEESFLNNSHDEGVEGKYYY